VPTKNDTRGIPRRPPRRRSSSSPATSRPAAGLPGALDALIALGGRLVQSLLTGNIRRIAEVKMHNVRPARQHLDLDVGAYGWSHPIRATWSRWPGRGAGRHGREYPGRSTVLIGDTPLDVEAALAPARRRRGRHRAHSAEELADAGPTRSCPT